MIIEVIFADIMESPPELCWRLSHNGRQVIDLHEGTEITGAPQLFCATTKEECLAEIERLGLIPLPDPSKEI